MDFKGPSANDGRGHHQNMGMGMSGGDKKPWMIGAIVVVILVVLAAGWWLMKTMGADAGIKKSQYQAVFLTNGQVYFCKLSNVTDKYVECSDIYYLQVQQAVQPADKNSTNNNSSVSLAKLGNELHGPEDSMHINRDQILFWENLKDDGKVVTTIHDNQKK